MNVDKRETRSNPASAAERDHGLTLLAGANAWAASMCAATSDFKLKTPPRTVVAWLGTLALLAALATLPGQFGVAHLLTIVGTICLVMTGIANTLRSAHSDATAVSDLENVAVVSDLLERRLEMLQDSKWELSESEARYREMLDTQDDLILRRNRAGDLTFVNRAFCAAFGVDQVEIFGTPFAPKLLDGPHLDPAPDADALHTNDITQCLETVGGPRWISWQRHQLPTDENGEFEIQLIGHDITRQRSAAAQLEEARDLAEAASRAKSRFLAAMSHEIRTPMNGILGIVGLLQETSQTPDQRTYTTAIDQSARTLRTLIDEILDFSKIEAGKVELNDAPFELEKCVQSVIELLAPQAHEKQLELAWNVDTSCPDWVHGDKARVRQILLNLLSNAIKFTDRGGIVVTATADAPRGADSGATSREGMIWLSVNDTGIGMSDSDRLNLFDEFEQADAAIHRHSGGTGLGLAISKRLAFAMGGDITISSQLGKGSTFTVGLRLPQTDTEDLRPTVLNGEHDDAHNDTCRHRVLLATDRKIERQVISSILQGNQIEVVEVSLSRAMDTIDAAHAEGASFDRVVVDAAGGRITAGRVLAHARNLLPAASVKGLVLIDAQDRGGVSRFTANGFDAYLVRPVRPRALLFQVINPGGDRHHDDRPVESTMGSPDPARREETDRQSSAEPKLILLAEDNAINELLATRIIEKAGNTPHCVRTGIEAVDYMRSVLTGEKPRPDLILMDIFMPGLDGVEATRQIKQMYAAHRASQGDCPPVIALTANAFDEDRRNYLDSGLDDYLSKPFEVTDLISLMARWSQPSQSPAQALAKGESAA